MVIEKARESARKFKNELKKALSSSLVAAFGLLTGLAWKEVVEGYVNELVSPQQGRVISALVITIISVAAIMIITKILSPEEVK